MKTGADRHAPILERMRTICRTLQAYLGNQPSDEGVDRDLLEMLDDITGPRKWLVASLDKTIRLQLGL